MPEKTTHYLVPESYHTRLRKLAQRTQVEQSEHLRNAVAALLDANGAEGAPLPTRWPTLPEERLTSVVFRLPEAHLDALKALDARTQVRRSVWVRKALADYLAEHEETECACGCGETFRQPRNGGPRRWYSDECARKAAKLEGAAA